MRSECDDMSGLERYRLCSEGSMNKDGFRRPGEVLRMTGRRVGVGGRGWMDGVESGARRMNLLFCGARAGLLYANLWVQQ